MSFERHAIKGCEGSARNQFQMIRYVLIFFFIRHGIKVELLGHNGLR